MVSRKKPSGFNKTNNKQKELLHFNSGLFLNAEFEASEDPNQISKKALVLVEGKHIDSAKRSHVFTPERIQRIVDNSNRLLDGGARISFLKDHKKTQDSTIGDVEGYFETKVITEEDLPNPRLKHLIGKVGAFASAIVAKGSQAVGDIQSGLIKTISPGIDIVEDVIREISATPTPAIVGPALFSRNAGNFALSFDEAEAEQTQEEDIEEQADNLLDTFLEIIASINSADEDMLQGANPYDLQMQAMNDYFIRLQELLGLGEPPMSEEEMMQQQQNMLRQQVQKGQIPRGGQMPGFLQAQQGIQSPGNYMKNNQVLAAFTMHDMEKLTTAEFGRGKDKAPRKKRSMLGTAAKVAGGAAAIGAVGLAGNRYGGKALKTAKRVYGQGRGMGLTKMQSLGGASKAFGGSIKKRVSSDAKKATRPIGKKLGAAIDRVAPPGKKLSGPKKYFKRY